MRLLRQLTVTRMWSFILYLGAYSIHWTTGEELKRGNYHVDIRARTSKCKILVKLTPINPGLEFENALDLSGLGLQIIEPTVFDNVRKLISLDLSNNNFWRIPSRALSNLHKLEMLSFADNSIHKISSTSFSGLNNLKFLNLSNNRIRYLERQNLLNLPESTEIVIKGNNFSELWNSHGYPFSWQRLPWEGHSWYLSQSMAQQNELRVLKFNQFPTTWALFRLYPFYVKLCKTNDGFVKYIGISPVGESPGDCQSINIESRITKLSLVKLGLKKFRAGWYQIPDNHFSLIDLSENEITEITPELLNDLPKDVSMVKLAFNKIGIIKNNVIQNRFLSILSLHGNFISTIEDSAFQNTSLEVLDLTSNFLTNLNFTKTLPMNIKELLLGKNKISEIPEGSLMNLKELVRFIMPENHLTHLPANVLRGLTKLREIDFKSNSLRTIESGAFSDNKIVAKLRLSHNRIQELPAGVFDSLERIEEIVLNFNRIKKITRDTFSGMRNSLIDYLKLAGNEIDTIEEGSFANMTIQSLHLHKNKLAVNSIEKGAFESCRIYDFTLNDNSFTSIVVEAFSELTLYGYLDLSYNKIKNINKGDAKYMTSIGTLHLEGNGLEHFMKGAFYGFPRDREVSISVDSDLCSIQVGLFNDDSSIRNSPQ